MKTLRYLLAGAFVAAMLFLGAFAPSDALAQCPSGATTVSRIDDGTRVTLLGLHSDDAYYSMRGSMIGLSGKVSGDLHSNDGCWMGGGFNGDDGTYYYFYKAAFSMAGGSGGTSCPAGATTRSNISGGTRVKLLGLHPDDAYYSMGGSMIGKTGRVEGDLHSNDGCWMGGGLTGDDGTYYYFYKAAFSELGGSPVVSGTSCPAGADTSSKIAGGTRVKLLGLHPDDAYYSMASSMIGLQGTVNGDLHSNDGCWMGGGFDGDDGTYYYFYKGAFTKTGGSGTSASACPAGATTVARIDDGARVKLLGLHPDDAYYGSRSSMVGISGKVSGDLHSNDGCWMGGGFYDDKGTYYYFYKAAFSSLGGSSGSGDRYMGSSVSAGQWFRIVALHSDDAYYGDRATMIGKTCKPQEMMPSQGAGWFSGPVDCTDGSYYYFYKVGVVLQ